MDWLYEPLFFIAQHPFTPARTALALAVLLGGWALGWLLEARMNKVWPEGWATSLLRGRLRWLVLLVALPMSLEALQVVRMEAFGAYLARFLDTRLFDLGGKPVTISTVAIVVFVMVLSFQLSNLLQRRLNKTMNKHGVSDEGGVAVGVRLTHYLVVLIGMMVGLQTAGVDLSALFAAGAVFAIGLGFAMQNLAQNFVSGVIILVEGAIKPGDILEVKGELVRVQKMGIRSTVVRNLDDIDVILPNGELVAGIKNHTLEDRLVRVRVPVGVTYGSDMQRVFAALQAAADGFSQRAMAQSPIVLMTGFGSSSVDFEVSVWTDQPFQVRRLKSGLLDQIWRQLKDEGIVIAFPQLDLHVDDEVVQAMRGAA